MPITQTIRAEAGDLLAVARVLARYYTTVATPTQQRLEALQHLAATIENPVARAIATAKLDRESLNAEAAAVFATLAPRGHRTILTRLIVTFEAMYDYLDGVTEERTADPVVAALAANRALVDVVRANEPELASGHPAYHWDDGGYLAQLVLECRDLLAQLPSAEIVRPMLLDVAHECATAQALAHAVPTRGALPLARWAATLRAPSGHRMEWWELAAGAASSLTLHALFALAAHAGARPCEARQTRGAYTATAALSTLLDSTVDRAQDERDGEHNFTSYYASDTETRQRLISIGVAARSSADRLRQPREHAVLGAGVAGFYLSAAPESRPLVRGLSPALGRSLVGVVLGACRARRAIHDWKAQKAV